MAPKAYIRRKLLNLLLDGDRTAEEIRAAVARLGLLSNSLGDVGAWMARTVEGATDLSPTAPLMKFVNNTWMPLEEGHFTRTVDGSGNYQSDTYERSLRHVASRRAALDIGANIGLWARRMCEDFETVHAFEPQSLARACLQRNVTANNCIVYPYAVGAERGRLVISGKSNNCGAARLLEKGKGEPVTVLPLDGLGLPPVDYVKIDVQGFELQVLRGARDLLRRDRPVITVEVDSSQQGAAELGRQVGRYLEELGFREAERVRKDAIFTPA